MTGRPTRRVLAVALVALAACHRSAPVRTAPSPTTEVSTERPAPAEGRRESAAAPDEPPAVSPTDVVAEAARIFGDSTSQEPDGPVGSGDMAPEPTCDIAVGSYETSTRVELCLQRSRGPVRATFSEWLSRGTRNEPMTRAKLQAAGLPRDRTYLARIQSVYNPHA